ncbi:MAG: glycosyltransferase family 4 protein [Gammaproteobacteria bacterium]|nr:glycosyltransferase family 4 protein [Gammaproteobacteria bacterium]
MLLITDNYSLSAGGAENYFFELKKRLEAEPTLAIFSLGFGEKPSHSPTTLILKKIQSNIKRLLWQIVFHPLVYFRIRQFIKAVQPDVIHLHNVKQYTFTLFLALRHYRVIQTIHDYGAVCPTAHNIHRDLRPCATGWRRACFWQHQVKFNRIIYLAQTCVHVLTQYLQKKFVQLCFAPSPELVTYLTHHQFSQPHYIPPFKKNLGLPQFNLIEPNHFFFAGQLGAHKGIFQLVKEFAQAYQSRPFLKLTIAGEGASKGKLKKLIHALKMQKNIHLIGWQPCLNDYYQRACAVIFPSVWMEAFGLIMMDSMLQGRPVIGSNRGSPTWLIEEGVTGLIFDPSEVGSLAKKIIWLADHPETIKPFGLAGYAKIQKLIDNETTIQQIITHYQNIAAH